MTEKLFLDALRAALKNEQVLWDMDIQPQTWMELFQMAQKHQILPMVYEAVYGCPAAQRMDPRFFEMYRKSTMQSVIMQMMRTNEFIELYKYLTEKGCRPIVMKGIICRELYPNPDHRMSGDEDLLIESEQFHAVHESLQEYGMSLSDPEMDIQAAYEVPYGMRGKSIYIELHKYLFPPDSNAYGEFNQFFKDVFLRAETVTVQGCEILTMCPTDHLFYLICHAFKHFLHSGFGIRQVCDIVLFANKYGSLIDWKTVYNNCRSIHADTFTASLFKIGKMYLSFDPEQACYPVEWREIFIDETAMLADLLDGGIYGDSNMNRKHSSTITLNAVSDDKKGKRGAVSIFRSVFPPRKEIENRYWYLRKCPVLLPVAWIDRIVHYRREMQHNKMDDAISAIRIGSRRVELLKKYGIIKE